MLTEEDKQEIRKIALESNKMESNELNIRIALNNINDKDIEDKYNEWAKKANDKFVNDGTTVMMFDLRELVVSRSLKYENWETLEENFIENYHEFLNE